VKFKYGNKVLKTENEIRNQIVEDVTKKAGDSLPALRTDLQVVVDIANFVENVVSKNAKIDKKQLCLSALHSLFDLDEDEMLTVSKHIDTLHSNKLFKKDKLAKQVFGIVKSIAVNFFLNK
jgi:hypothetical protein